MSQRPAVRPGSDGLGLRQALSDRLLPSLVAAMAFLAGLALAGAAAAQALAGSWSAGAGTLLTVQVPDPTEPSAARDAGTRLAAVRRDLASECCFTAVRLLDEAELRSLLQPWLAGDAPPGPGSGMAALPLPAVLQLHLPAGAAPPTGLAARLEAAAPGTLVENSAGWRDRLLALTTSLQACAVLVLLVVASVAASVVALATRSAIVARRQAIEIIHALGATDGYLAGRFARRTARLAAIGGIAGLCLSLPVLGLLAHLAAPFARAHLDPSALPGSDASGGASEGIWPRALRPGALLAVPLLLALPAIPAASSAIGWFTAQMTVRLWLRRLP